MSIGNILWRKTLKCKQHTDLNRPFPWKIKIMNIIYDSCTLFDILAYSWHAHVHWFYFQNRKKFWCYSFPSCCFWGNKHGYFHLKLNYAYWFSWPLPDSWLTEKLSVSIKYTFMRDNCTGIKCHFIQLACRTTFAPVNPVISELIIDTFFIPLLPNHNLATYIEQIWNGKEKKSLAFPCNRPNRDMTNLLLTQLQFLSGSF